MNLIALALLACARQGEAAKDPAARWTIDFKLNLEEKGEEWVFVVEGTTNLPPQTVLRTRIYAVETVDDFRQGKREDEEPMVWDGDPDAGQPGSQNFKSTGGKFRVEVYRFRRRPYAIHYRGRVHYYPNLQDDAALRTKLGDEDFSRQADIKPPSKEEYARQLRDRGQEVHDDIVLADALFKEIQKKYAEQLAKPDPAAWKTWKDVWYARVEALDDKNKLRFGMWAVWMERQAKMRIGGMAELLRRILVAAGDHLKDEKEAAESAKRLIEAFPVYLEEAIEAIGINMPLDTEKIAPLLEAYDKAIGGLRAWSDKREGDADAVLFDARRECAAALFRITPLIQNRKRAYRYVNELTSRFTQLLELAEAKADAATLKKAFAEHDQAMAEFRKLAGVPAK
jgi:hypothetical protein